MAKRLNPEDLKIETFETGSAKLMAPGRPDCTGCISGCGIFVVEPVMAGQ
ncbi:MAG TPA: hypothetical protein VE913_01500 [Longimicrobium sp.]|nr:hypothetical protein [Longimicrobium sp.]